MANRIWNTVSLVVALSAPLMIAAPLAAQTAECQPGDIVCGEVQVGPIDGRFRIGFGQDAPPPPPPPPVVYQPPPPVVIVEPPPPPPPVVYQPPPPPPPQVIYQQPPQPVYQVPQPQLIQRRVRYQLVPRFDIGLHLNVGAMATDRIGIGGGGAGLRIRPIEWFAIDIGAGIYGGQAYGGSDHWEVPVLADLIFFFNPGDTFQVYGLVGGGIAFGENGVATRTGIGGRDGFIPSRSLFYVGGEAGLGLEWRMARHFAMNIDVRAFVRQQLDGAPEFQEATSTGTRTTNTSAGAYGNLGMTFYFIGL